MSLFTTDLPYVPLAEKMRPDHWQDVVGQKHLLGESKPLARAFTAGVPHSMIFWGPPGVGKTTLAKLAAKAFDGEWLALSAVLAGVKEIRAAVEQAQKALNYRRHTILFIDEIHRFNKSQQDALLPHTESGLLTFIGATTENPSFEVNNALLSRAQVYVLNALTEEELRQLVQRAIDRQYIKTHFLADAIDYLVSLVDGDARRLFNYLEQIEVAAKQENTQQLSREQLICMLTPVMRRFDKAGDLFYDQISALHKSVRGSNPDAALYWLCRMLDGGVDAHYLARRIIRMAWEDIGLADPRAMQIANEAAITYDRLGSPEGELALAQAVIYLATAAKSNAGYVAFNQAREFIKTDKSREVPIHLRNAPTYLLKKLGHGQAYRYAHDEPYGYAADANYFPEGMNIPSWYKPVERGLEQKIAEKLKFLQQLDEEARRKQKK